MAHRFRGGDINKVDAKGRVSIPALFRRVLEASDPEWKEGLNPNFVIIYAAQKHMIVYTAEAMDEIDRKISSLPRGSDRRQKLEDVFYDMALPGQTDDAGRMLLPSWLRDKYKIGKDARFRARGDTFHIMTPELYEERTAETKTWLEDQSEDFDPAVLLDLDDGLEV